MNLENSGDKEVKKSMIEELKYAMNWIMNLKLDYM